MASIEEVIEVGRKYVLPHRQEEWNNLINLYANSNVQELNLAVLQNAINVMETLENEPTTDNIFKCAKDIERKDPSFAHQVESILFTFSRFGPLICLALPIAREQLNIESYPQQQIPDEVPFRTELLTENIDQLMKNICSEKNMNLTDGNNRSI